MKTMDDLCPKPSPILPFLYLGNERDADSNNLDQLDITYVLSIESSQLSTGCQKLGVVYKRLNAGDSYHQNLKQHFEEAFEFIGKFFVYVYLALISFDGLILMVELIIEQIFIAMSHYLLIKLLSMTKQMMEMSINH